MIWLFTVTMVTEAIALPSLVWWLSRAGDSRD